MSIEYEDGTFSDPLPIEKAIERFTNEIKEGIPVVALHVGTEGELLLKAAHRLGIKIVSDTIVKEKMIEEKVADFEEALEKHIAEFSNIQENLPDAIEKQFLRKADIPIRKGRP